MMVEGELDTGFEYGMLLVILTNVILLIVSTIVVEGEDCFRPHSHCIRLNDRYETFFEAAEWTSVGLFTFEYILRMWSCVERSEVAARGPIWGRIVFGLTFFPLIDLLSILPNWLSLIPGLGESPDFTTAARIVRLVRLFKTEKYTNAFALLGEVLADNATLLIISCVYASIVWVAAATLLFFTEGSNPSLGGHFQSIPASMYPTLLMLTGEYPLVDFSPMGQVVSGFIAVVAVAVFAVPTGVIGSGFVQALQQSHGAEFTVGVD